ncbi:MAG: hypothetical protein PHX61_07770 [Alphaproteobacteria bacterium]|nr:hypothetical protein [Alphaproteobacteria bacterium]
MEDEDSRTRFDHFNSEINLLSIKIILEAFKRGEDILTVGDFIRNAYWKEEEIFGEIYEAEEFSTTEDLVLAQIAHIIEDFGIGRLKMISVVGIDELRNSVIKKAIEEKDARDIDDLIQYYSWILGEIYGLSVQSGEMQMKAIKKGIADWKYYENRVDFEVSSAKDGHIYIEPLGIGEIVHIAAPFIEIKVDYKNSKAEDLNRELRSFLERFADDKFLDRLPIYRDKRYHFSRQMENFVDYISRSPLVNNRVNVPSEVLDEKGFEFVKIVSYLEERGKVRVSDWKGRDAWNIEFYQTPISVESLLFDDKVEEKGELNKKLKISLSFDETKSILRMGEKDVKIRKMSDQYHLLKIIFEDQEEIGKEWFYPEIAEKYDHEANFDDKKFYNAAYQVNQKIARDTGIRDALITTTQSVRINSEYLR